MTVITQYLVKNHCFLKSVNYFLGFMKDAKIRLLNILISTQLLQHEPVRSMLLT